MSDPGRYRVCGGVLESALPFTELPPADGAGAADWVLLMPAGPAPPLDGEPKASEAQPSEAQPSEAQPSEAQPSEAQPGEPKVDLLGQDEVTDTATVRLLRGTDRLRLDFTDTGIFDVLGDGRTIHWYPLPDSDHYAAALDVIGRVLAVCFHAAGLLCLHGSAVALARGTVAFLAPKYHGKSTTALALTRAGGRLVTDDMLPVELVSPALAHPGVHAVRLWEDSASQIAQDDDVREGVGGKLVLDDLSEESRMDDVTELLAVYLLHPVLDEPEAPAVERVRTASIESAMALMGQNKIGPLLGKSEAPVLLDRSLRLSELVPVYQLRIARNFDRLPEVVAQLQEWHADQPDGSAVTDRG